MRVSSMQAGRYVYNVNLECDVPPPVAGQSDNPERPRVCSRAATPPWYVLAAEELQLEKEKRVLMYS